VVVIEHLQNPLRGAIENDFIREFLALSASARWWQPQSPRSEGGQVLSQADQPPRQAAPGAKVKPKSRTQGGGSVGAPPLAKGLIPLQDRGQRENLGAAYVAS
jgi:hypothetical protein